MIDATICGALMSKTPEVAYALLDDLASNNYWWTFEMSKPKPVVGVLEHDYMSNIVSQLADLNKRLDRFEKHSVNDV